MADRPGPDAESKRRHERARRAVFGHLAPAILHETNNVLTVMAGIRQLMKSGAPVSDRIGTMIDEQLQRMDQLVTSIRRIGPEEGVGGNSSTLKGLADAIDQVIRLAAKGRGVTVEPGDCAAASPADSEALALASLCLVLPLFPPRGASGGARLRIQGAADGPAVRVALTFSPLREVPAAEDEAVARELLEIVHGTLETRATDGAYEATLVVPAAGPSRDGED